MKQIFLFSISISVLFVSIVLSLVKKNKLKEQYSLLWIFFGMVMIILSTNSKWLDSLASFLGVQYHPALLFLAGFVICLSLLLHLTVVVSELSGRVVRLTQEIGILKCEIAYLKQRPNMIEDNMEEVAATVAQSD